MKDKFKMGDKVISKINPSKSGIITGIFQRPSAGSFSVSWDDLTERSHFEMEIVAMPTEETPIGFTARK